MKQELEMMKREIVALQTAADQAESKNQLQ